MADTPDKIERVIDLKAPVSRVWQALTDHNEFGEWFRVKLDQPFVPGGESTGRITYPGYEHMLWFAMVVDMQPETLFSFTWSPNDEEGEGGHPKEPRILVEFRLEPIAQGTRLTLCESGFSQLPEESRDETYIRNSGGWDEQAKNIARYVE